MYNYDRSKRATTVPADFQDMLEKAIVRLKATTSDEAFEDPEFVQKTVATLWTLPKAWKAQSGQAYTHVRHLLKGPEPTPETAAWLDDVKKQQVAEAIRRAIKQKWAAFELALHNPLPGAPSVTLSRPPKYWIGKPSVDPTYSA